MSRFLWSCGFHTVRPLKEEIRMNAAIPLTILAAVTAGSVHVIDPVDPVEGPSQVHSTSDRKGSL
jgi:hypothetical protein